MTNQFERLCAEGLYNKDSIIAKVNEIVARVAAAGADYDVEDIYDLESICEVAEFEYSYSCGYSQTNGTKKRSVKKPSAKPVKLASVILNGYFSDILEFFDDNRDNKFFLKQVNIIVCFLPEEETSEVTIETA